VSVLNRKRASEAEAADMRGRVLQLTRRGARSAAAWTAPRVSAARAWTAPRIERSGLAIRDTIAPKICEVFVVTARRVDVTPPRRRWPRVVAGTALLAVAAAAVAVVLRRRADDGTCGAPGRAAGAGTSPETAQDGQPGADAGSSGAEADVSRQFPGDLTGSN
jgi:hypothetical protein